MASRTAGRLFVSNLAWTVSSRELRQYFSQFGAVAQANVIFDKNTGMSRNYAFVVFATRDGYNKALTHPHHTVEGQLVNIQPTGNTTD